jgi:hypothetical protein
VARSTVRPPLKEQVGSVYNAVHADNHNTAALQLDQTNDVVR